MNSIFHSLSRKYLNTIDGYRIRSILKQIESEGTTLSQKIGCLISEQQVKALSQIPLFEQIYHSLFLLSKKYSGSSRLFIALDGIAPMAKWELQKKRRHSFQNSAALDGHVGYGREALTPGTSLMFLLERTLFWLAKDYLSANSYAQNTDPFVLIDSSCRAGEAEWKAIQYLKLSIKEQCDKVGLSGEDAPSISLSSVLDKKKQRLLNIRRVLCASDSDSMLMALAYPINSLVTVDPSSAANNQILFSPSLLVKSLANISSHQFLDFRDGLILLSLLCMGSDYISRLKNMPSIYDSWNYFVRWTKTTCNWQLIDRKKRSINMESLKSYLSFCKTQARTPSFNEDSCDNTMDIELTDNVNCGSVDSYISILACNLDIIYTGICRFFSIERVSSPTIDDIINWSSTRKFITSPVCTAPSQSLLVPGAMAMLLIPTSRHLCLAGPLQGISCHSHEEGLLLNPLSDVQQHPSIQELEMKSNIIASAMLSALERDYTFGSNYPSVISLPFTQMNSHCEDLGLNKFSRLFSLSGSPYDRKKCTKYMVHGKVPFGIDSMPQENTASKFSVVSSLYQDNGPDVCSWTDLEQEITLLNSISQAG